MFSSNRMIPSLYCSFSHHLHRFQLMPLMSTTNIRMYIFLLSTFCITITITITLFIRSTQLIWKRHCLGRHMFYQTIHFSCTVWYDPSLSLALALALSFWVYDKYKYGCAFQVSVYRFRQTIHESRVFFQKLRHICWKSFSMGISVERSR